MVLGSVKWFDNRKGFGFLQSDAHEEDVFVHFSSIEAEGFRTLKDDEEVAFELAEGPKGPFARSVRRLAEEDLEPGLSASASMPR